MSLTIWDVEHGACATLMPVMDGQRGLLAMIDSGDSATWRPSDYITRTLGRRQLDYLMITNADQDHMSDLNGLLRAGIAIDNLLVNEMPDVQALRRIKEAACGARGLTEDVEAYLALRTTHTTAPMVMFDQRMGGIRRRSFHNSYPDFDDTNNLSLVVFIEFHGFKIVFPGDLAREGWLSLLIREDFRAELRDIDILVASHHGREDGYCEEVFDWCAPSAVVISDKEMVHGTQEMVPTYRNHIEQHHPGGVIVNDGAHRRVLTTRRDGHIRFTVNEDGRFWVTLENG